MNITKGLAQVSFTIGRGIIAGLAGTAAITIAQNIEMAITGRVASEAPSKVGGKVMGVQPRNQQGKQEFSQIMHWSYGTSWGMFRSVLSTLGINGPEATALHFSAIWTTELIMVPSLTETPHPSKWGAGTLLKDAMFHLIYATAAGLVDDLLENENDK